MCCLAIKMIANTFTGDIRFIKTNLADTIQFGVGYFGNTAGIPA